MGISINQIKINLLGRTPYILFKIHNKNEITEIKLRGNMQSQKIIN